MYVSIRYAILPEKITAGNRSFLEEFKKREKVADKDSLDQWRRAMKSFRFESAFLRQFEDDEIKVSFGRDAMIEIVDENPEVIAAVLRKDDRVNPDYAKGMSVIARGLPMIVKPGIYTEGDLFVAVAIDKVDTLSISMHTYANREVNLYAWLDSASNVLRQAIGLPTLGTAAAPFSAALPGSV